MDIVLGISDMSDRSAEIYGMGTSLLQRDGIFRAQIIYRNLWSLVSLAHFITHLIWIFKSTQHTNTL